MKRRFAVHVTDENPTHPTGRPLYCVAVVEGGKTLVGNVSGCRSDRAVIEAWVEEWNADPLKAQEIVNLRWWHYHRGWVKLTLRPGQVLNHCRSYDNGEGWSHDWERWTHRGEDVFREYGSSGSDCDGPHSTWGEGTCPVVKFAMPLSPDPAPPDWEYGKGGQRDIYAEQMNY